MDNLVGGPKVIPVSSNTGHPSSPALGHQLPWISGLRVWTGTPPPPAFPYKEDRGQSQQEELMEGGVLGGRDHELRNVGSLWKKTRNQVLPCHLPREPAC